MRATSSRRHAAPLGNGRLPLHPVLPRPETTSAKLRPFIRAGKWIMETRRETAEEIASLLHMDEYFFSSPCVQLTSLALGLVPYCPFTVPPEAEPLFVIQPRSILHSLH